MTYIETEKVELKRILNEMFEKEVVAFLNSHDGIIYIGVEDNGEICGVDKIDETMKKIANIISTCILPNTQELINVSVLYVEGKFIIEVRVKKGKVLYYINKYGRSSKGCYIRVGTSCRSMTEEQINHRFLESIKASKYSLIDELSPRQDLTFRILKIYLDSYGVFYNENNFAVNNHLLTKDGKYNYQAFILSDQNDLSYKIARWEGKTKMSKYLNCSVLKAIDDINSYIKSTHNIVRSFFNDGNTARRDEYLIDQESFREGWVNACLHNDYSKHLGPAVYLFSDHLEIFSYGTPLSVQSKEDFFKGVSIPINPELANVFMRMEKTETSGKGVSTIVEKYGMDVFEFGAEHLTIKLPYNKIVLETENIPQNVPQSSQIDKKIVLETEDVPQNVSQNSQIDKKIEFETENVPQNVPQNSQIDNKIVLETEDVPQNVPQNSQNDKKIELETEDVPQKNDEEIIVEMIKYNPRITRKEMAESIGKTVKTVQRIINESKKIKYVGSSKFGYWEIIE